MASLTVNEIASLINHKVIPIIILLETFCIHAVRRMHKFTTDSFSHFACFCDYVLPAIEFKMCLQTLLNVLDPC